eukprot:CAMPEP_0184483188 /NCGR_PEP_ID=MMETSP0113_2-20130426/4828_1 /TAXON_ID=91329 /ORGANISM="Norrisiella sphaerica, Strain BC52" /LENGTH=456 /DNA_ID=CAMNT_0026863437 /DNA_START=280 /DNA_END=1650 /DNA_ORIENTATION=+
MTSWTEDDVENLKENGNRAGKKLWLKKLDTDTRPLPTTDNQHGIRAFIKEVFVEKKYMRKTKGSNRRSRTKTGSRAEAKSNASVMQAPPSKEKEPKQQQPSFMLEFEEEEGPIEEEKHEPQQEPEMEKAGVLQPPEMPDEIKTANPMDDYFNPSTGLGGGYNGVLNEFIPNGESNGASTVSSQQATQNGGGAAQIPGFATGPGGPPAASANDAMVDELASMLEQLMSKYRASADDVKDAMGTALKKALSSSAGSASPAQGMNGFGGMDAIQFPTGPSSRSAPEPAPVPAPAPAPAMNGGGNTNGINGTGMGSMGMGMGMGMEGMGMGMDMSAGGPATNGMNGGMMGATSVGGTGPGMGASDMRNPFEDASYDPSFDSNVPNPFANPMAPTGPQPNMGGGGMMGGPNPMMGNPNPGVGGMGGGMGMGVVGPAPQVTQKPSGDDLFGFAGGILDEMKK